MRTRIIYSPNTGKKMAEFQNGELVFSTDEFYTPEPQHLVMGDIKPYKSMIDGSIIHSRSRHREHLKAHGCVEVGNDSSLRAKPKPIPIAPGLKEDIIRATNEVLDRRR